MKNHIYLLAALTCLFGVLETNESAELKGILSRLAALEEKEQTRTTHQQKQDSLIEKLQNELKKERRLRHNLERELVVFKQRLDKQDRLVASQNDEIKKQTKFMENLKHDDVKDFLYKRQGSGFMETAAFHSTLDQDSGLEHITVGSTIPFPNVKLNIGGGYDNTTSTFTAPMSGLYIFSVSISSYWNDHGELHVGVMKNGVYLAGAYVDDIGGPPEQGSVTIPMELNTGDKVWIKHVVHDDGALYGGGLTSFMGCLVYAL